MNPDNGQVSVFMLNRDLQAERELILEWHDVTPTRVVVSETLTGADLKASNSFDKPGVVVPQTLDAPKVGAKMTLRLPPRSYSVLVVATS
jgi:alpha-N-arabinofuranosidase